MTPADDRRVRTVFIGTGAFAVPALRALAASPDVAIVGVVTAPARPAGRRAELRPSPVADAASDLALAPILTPDRLRAPHAIASVLELRPELVVLADYGQIVPALLLAVPHGALNLHPSLLPRHRGASPIPAAILAGDSTTGVALMQMDAGLDTGPLVAVEERALDGTETAPDLEAELAQRGADLLARTLPAWIDGRARAVPQANDGATLTRPLHREDGRLDPTRPAAVLGRQVRAFRPWPGAFLDTDLGRFSVLAAQPGALHGDLPAVGTVYATGRDLVLATSDGALRLVELQPSGGKPMSAAAFLRGRPGFGATVLPGPPAAPIEQPVGSSTTT